MKEINDITRAIKKGEVAPVYLFDGDEPYFIDMVSDAFEHHLLQPHERDFNLSILYGKDIQSSIQVVNECRAYPVMAQRKLVLIKEAAQMKPAVLYELESYCKNPSPSTTLVIAYKYGKFDKRKSLVKEAVKQGAVALTFDKIKEHKLPEWVLDYAKTHQWTLTPQNAQLICEYLGNNLQKIANELGKLALNLTDTDREINADKIEKYIGVSKEYNGFEYAKAVLNGDVEKAFKVAQYFITNPKSGNIIMVLGMLYSEFRKIYLYHYSAHLQGNERAAAMQIPPFALNDYHGAARHYTLPKTIKAIECLHEYNLKAIGVNQQYTGQHLLKELTAQLFSL